MWAEARKHEKKLRGLMVDYRRRAERRREFYDRIRSDPAAFLQIHGNQMKIHIDPTLCSAAESSLMPWMGDTTNMIDRFDVRAHLDRLDLVNNTTNTSNNNTDSVPNSSAEEALERQINYERYRNLVQNEFLGLNESKFLQQIWFEERFGVNNNNTNNNQKDVQNKGNQKKKLAEKKATIAYNYDNDDINSQTIQTKNSESEESEESSDEDYDFDTTVNIDQLDNESGHRINSIGVKFGMKNDDFVKYLDEDKTEAEKIRVQKEIENEKSMFTGRKSRRERRALKEQRLMILRAANVEEIEKIPNKKKELEKMSSSDSEDSVDETKIEFITSFGGTSEEDKPKEEEERKQKQVIAKRKQKIKALINQKSESIPIVYGPTLPGEDAVPSITSTSFKSSHSKQRTYRFNDSMRRSRTRSRSHSIDRFKYRRSDTRRYSRRSRTRSRSPQRKRSSNRTPDRYRERKRSRSRDRNRYRSRSRSRNRNTRRRSRSRSPKIRRRSRSSSRTKRPTRRRSRSLSRNRRDRSRSKRRSRSPKKSRSVDKERDRELKRRNKSSPERSRSKSQNKKDVNSVAEETTVPTLIKTDMIIENTSESLISESKFNEIELKSTNDFISEALDSELEKESIKEENAVKAPSPPVRSYYRHDLCESGSDEELPQKDGNRTEKDEGSKKRSSNVSNVNLNSGYKCSMSSTIITPQERLKKKRQALIDKQYKLDKKAELQKLEKQQQEREDREEELREMTTKLRNRRDLHRDRRGSRSSSRSQSVSSSSSSSSSY